MGAQPQRQALAQSTVPRIQLRKTSERRCEWDPPKRYEAWNSPNFKSFPDGDPPFFLRYTSPSGATDTGVDRNRYASEPTGSDGFKGTMQTDVDSTVRSIIDDLTVENRWLRARNKSLEKIEKYYREADEHKLFEIRLHNISPNDARALEEILTTFVRNKGASGNHHPQRLSELSEANVQSKMAQMLVHKNMDANNNSIHASGTSKLDSGYASMSLTPGTSLTPYNNISPGQRKDASLRGDSAKNPLLLHVPRGLLPGQPRITTERSKKKLVVQRLEGLFTGKKSLLGAKYYHTKHNALVRQGQESGAAEGVREANIMIHGSSKYELANAGEQEIESAGDVGTESDKSSEQRPTRPFDLDPERQQIPSENVDYMRHLGISTPDLQHEDSQDAEADAGGWVYLNLLMNMAQLHIMNVTADFVRDAVKQVSSKFQLSSDGTRLRWRGGTQPTQLSSLTGSSTADSRSSPDSSVEAADDHVGDASYQAHNLPHAKPKKGNGWRSSSHDHTTTKDRKLDVHQGRHVAHYSPMFEHPSSHNTDTGSSGVTFRNHVPAIHKRVFPPDPRYVPPGKKQKPANNRARGMVFYDDASFFVDLGGAILSSELGNTSDIYDYPNYKSDRRSVLGCEAQRGPSPECSAIKRDWDRLVLRDSVLRTPAPVTSTMTDSDSNFNFATSTEDVGAERATPLLKFPVRLEVSGLGSTVAADHFLETVTSRIVISKSPSSAQDDSCTTLPTRSRTKPNKVQTQALEALCKRIQARTAFRAPQITVPAPSHHGRHFAEGESGSSSSLPNKPVKPADLNPFAEPIVKRDIIDVTFHRLRPSSPPAPGLYFSEVSASTESDAHEMSESQRNDEVLEAPDEETSSGDNQSNLVALRDLGSWPGDGRETTLREGDTNPDAAPSLSRKEALQAISGTEEASESSGCGDEEDDEDDDESIDMLRFAREADPSSIGLAEMEWDMEKAREVEMENAMGEVVSGQAVQSVETDGSISDDESRVST